MTDLAPPAPASHDPRVPTGVLEESAASLFEAMLAAQEAEGSDNAEPQESFYRAFLAATLLLPVPTGTQDEARRSLATAVGDQEEVEIPVMLARDGEGNAVSVVFGSGAALAAWSPTGSGSIALPARIVVQNLAASGFPATLDPAGPIPYRFEADELRSLASGLYASTSDPVAPRGTPASVSLHLRLPGPEADEIEAALAPALARTPADEAYLVESQERDGPRLVVGVVADEDGMRPHIPALGAALDQRRETIDLVVLHEPVLSEVRQLTEPFYTRRRGLRR